LVTSDGISLGIIEIFISVSELALFKDSRAYVVLDVSVWKWYWNAGWTGVIGAAGPKGDIGPIGQPGQQGSPGIQGDAGTPGNPGNQGPSGQPGPQGAAGQPGDTGLTGDTGWTGLSGPKGQIGQSGPQGCSMLFFDVVTQWLAQKIMQVKARASVSNWDISVCTHFQFGYFSSFTMTNRWNKTTLCYYVALFLFIL